MKTKTISSRYPILAKGMLAISGILLLIHVTSAAPIISLSDDPVAENVDYNIKIGGLELDFVGLFSAEYDSNINYQNGDNKDSGLALLPGLSTRAFWAITPNLLFDTNVSVEYRYYGSGDGDDTFLFHGVEDQAAANFDFEFLLGDDSIFVISNQFSGNSDTISRVIAVPGGPDPTVNTEYTYYNYSGSGDYAQRLTPYTRLNLGVTYGKMWSASSDFSYNDRISSGFYGRLNSQIQEEFTAGLIGSVQKLDFTEDLRNNGDEYAVGIEFRKSTTAGASFFGSIQAQKIEFDISNDLLATEQSDWSPVFDLGVSVSIGQFTTHSISVSNGADTATSVLLNSSGSGFTRPNYQDTFGIDYTLEYTLTENLQFNLSADYQDVSESDNGLSYKTIMGTLGTQYEVGQNSSIFMTLRYQNRFDANLSETSFNRFIGRAGLRIGF